MNDVMRLLDSLSRPPVERDYSRPPAPHSKPVRVHELDGSVTDYPSITRAAAAWRPNCRRTTFRRFLARGPLPDGRRVELLDGAELGGPGGGCGPLEHGAVVPRGSRRG